MKRKNVFSKYRLSLFFSRKPIIPQKEPSPLLEKKIQQLEAKFAELEGGEEDIEEIGEEEGEVAEAPTISQLQTPHSNELDIMPYTPPQVIWLTKSYWRKEDIFMNCVTM